MNEVINVIGIYFIPWAENMKLCRAAAESVAKATSDGCLAVLHARSDFREQDIAFGEMGESLADFTQLPLTQLSKLRSRFAQRGHRCKRYHQTVVEIAGMAWIDIGDVAE